MRRMSLNGRRNEQSLRRLWHSNSFVSDNSFESFFRIKNVCCESAMLSSVDIAAYHMWYDSQFHECQQQLWQRNGTPETKTKNRSKQIYLPWDFIQYIRTLWKQHNDKHKIARTRTCQCVPNKAQHIAARNTRMEVIHYYGPRCWLCHSMEMSITISRESENKNEWKDKTQQKNIFRESKFPFYLEIHIHIQWLCPCPLPMAILRT